MPRYNLFRNIRSALSGDVLHAYEARQLNSVLNALRESSDPLVVLGFVELMWPSFVEYSGCLLISAEFDAKNADEWLRRLGNNIKEVERVMNHVHLWDVLDGLPADSAVHDVVGAILTQSWPAAAQAQFPACKLEAVYVNNDSEYGPTVSCWQSRA